MECNYPFSTENPSIPFLTLLWTSVQRDQLSLQAWTGGIRLFSFIYLSSQTLFSYFDVAAPLVAIAVTMRARVIVPADGFVSVWAPPSALVLASAASGCLRAVTELRGRSTVPVRARLKSGSGTARALPGAVRQTQQYKLAVPVKRHRL